MISAPGRRDKNRYCEYHREHGHETNECRILKAELEKLIKGGYLKEFVDKETQRDAPSHNRRSPLLDNRPKVKREQLEAPPVTGRINTISGGIAGGGDSRNSRKSYAIREVYSLNTTTSINELITFSNQELQGIETPHDDPIMIVPIIANFIVERMLVDTGTSSDIVDKLQLPRSLLQPLHTPLTGFTGHSVFATGVVTLDFTVGCASKSSTIRAQFTVVDIKGPSYNGLIGRPILTALRAHSLKDEIPNPGGIGEVCGDQKRARICCQTSVPLVNRGKKEQGYKRGRENHMEVNVMRGEEEEDNAPKERESGKKGEPNEELESVPFRREVEKTFRIGTNLESKHRR
ncbi:hypothetical protein LIER_18538 [Lithospermum erythrorhizon]|uniref:Uncharacterized protein n=1 Tax=Lithospermum erythrorhizon TaxID=34254 RepID=A0AAV3QH05_LITER